MAAFSAEVKVRIATALILGKVEMDVEFELQGSRNTGAFRLLSDIESANHLARGIKL